MTTLVRTAVSVLAVVAVAGVAGCPAAVVDNEGEGESGAGEGEGESGVGEGEGEFVVGEGEGEGEGAQSEGEGEGESVVVDCDASDIVSGVLGPAPGEVFWQQLGLGGFATGEAALLVLPDGSRVLVDVGNDSHDDDVLDALDEHFAADAGDHHIDAIVLTHHHADHEGALTSLLQDLDVDTVIHRGFVDVTPAANEDLVVEVCDALDGGAQDGALCERSASGCALATLQAPPTSCALPRDVVPGVDIVGADGFFGADSFSRDVHAFLADDSNGENARSVVAVVRHGAFRMVFAGDLTGGGSDTDDVEGFAVSRLGADVAGGVDVLHLSHHARHTSSSQVWLDGLLPNDGHPRTAIAGISTAHINSPHQEVTDAVLDGRLNGGGFWSTGVAVGGVASAGSADVVDAGGGSIRLRTEAGGDRVLVQAVDDNGVVLRTQQITTSRACQPR